MKKDFFTVGPAALYPNIDEYLRDFLELGYGSISHRSEAFRDIYKNTVSALKQLLNIPDSLDVDNRDLAMLVSTRLYEQGKLSLGQAAEVAGLTKRTFAELLGSYGVSIFNFPATDLSRDVANA